MGDYQTIIDEVATILSEKTKIRREHLKPDLHLEESGLDSFARIELVLAMEEHFSIEMSDSEAADLSTVDDVVRLIINKQESAAAKS